MDNGPRVNRTAGGLILRRDCPVRTPGSNGTRVRAYIRGFIGTCRRMRPAVKAGPMPRRKPTEGSAARALCGNHLSASRLLPLRSAGAVMPASVSRVPVADAGAVSRAGAGETDAGPGPAFHSLQVAGDLPHGRTGPGDLREVHDDFSVGKGAQAKEFDSTLPESVLHLNAVEMSVSRATRGEV